MLLRLDQVQLVFTLVVCCCTFSWCPLRDVFCPVEAFVVVTSSRCTSLGTTTSYAHHPEPTSRRNQSSKDSNELEENVPATKQQRESSSSSVITTTVVQDLKAGEDGYSLLRQPLARTNWDPDAQPAYQPPRLLDESKSEFNQVDVSWWQARQRQHTPSGKIQKSPPQSTSSSLRSISNNNYADDTDKAHQDFNLLQRSLDTLDYPRVLRALQAECTTAPARRMVQQAQSVGTRTPTTAMTSKSQQSSSSRHVQ